MYVHFYPLESNLPRTFSNIDQFFTNCDWMTKKKSVFQKRSLRIFLEADILEYQDSNYHRSSGTGGLPFLLRRRICRNSSNRLRRGRSKVETATSFVNLHGGSYCQEPPMGQLSIPGGWRLCVV